MKQENLIILRALSNDSRLQILDWLKDPEAHFEPQVDGDLVEDGVCSGRIADKLGISAPALSSHMKLLSEAGLVRGQKIKGWVFYQRLDDNIIEAISALAKTV